MFAFQTLLRRFQCHLCHLIFDDQSAVSAHYDAAHMIHTQIITEHKTLQRPEEQRIAKHACGVCCKKFATRNELYEHRQTVHANMKPYQCEICLTCFNSKDSMKVHLWTLHGVGGGQSANSVDRDTAHAQRIVPSRMPVRPEHPDAKYPCEVCGRKFTKRNNLNQHVQVVHSDVKPFQCDICLRGFTQKSGVKLHLSTVHGIGVVLSLPCDVCGKIFKRRDYLRRHLTAVHGLKEVSS